MTVPKSACWSERWALVLKGLPTTTTLRVLSLASIILGVFWSAYALANGFRTINGDSSYFIPQAAQFLFWGIAGWAVFGSLGKIMKRLEALEQGTVAGD